MCRVTSRNEAVMEIGRLEQEIIAKSQSSYQDEICSVLFRAVVGPNNV